jgi:hypothetical protein
VVAVDQKFGKDLYHNYMKDILSIRQTGDVLEYASRFEQAKHRVLVHNKDMGEVFFVQKFLDGLKYNISNAISLHKPRTVDAALSLALMQEDIIEASSKRFSPRVRDYSRSAVKTSALLNQGSSVNPSVLGAPPDNHKTKDDKQQPKWDTKYESLRAKRRAAGLCMKCGEAYSPQHRCPKQVNLHVVEELMEVFQHGNAEDKEHDSSALESEEELLALSLCAADGTQGAKTIRIPGVLHTTDIPILIDSGSSGTFVSEQLVSDLKLPTTPISPATVRMADGTTLKCTQQVTSLTWWSQGNTFTTDAKVLPLGSYDLILGMDWLGNHSPMWIHWQRHRLRFTHNGKRITLTGVKDNLAHCKKITTKKLKGLIRKNNVVHVLQLAPSQHHHHINNLEQSELDTVLHNFSDLFQDPKGLPP